jgi:hypothetical protein
MSNPDYKPIVVGEELPADAHVHKRGKWDEAIQLARSAPGQWVEANDDCSVSVLYHLRNGKFPATRDIDRSQFLFEKRRDPERHAFNRCAIYVKFTGAAE